MTKTNAWVTMIVGGVAIAACGGRSQQQASYPPPPEQEPVGAVAEPEMPPVETPGMGEQQPVAGTEEQPMPTGEKGGVITDQEFVNKAVSAGMFETKSSQVAMQKFDLGPLRSFAQMMVKEHGQTNERLKEVARANGLSVPDQMLPQHQQLLTRIEQANKDQMPQLYKDIQIQAHQQSIELFERCAKTCKDPEVRTFAEGTVPTLREHLSQLQGQGAPRGQQSP